MRPDRFFVTPHALRQFRERVTPDLSDEEIIRAITEQLAGVLPVWVGVPPQQHVGTLLFPFRWGNRTFTIPVGPGTEGPWPAVMTIRPGDDKLRRYDRWKSPKSPWKRRQTMQAQFLLAYGYSIEDAAKVLRYPVETVRRRIEDAARGIDAPDDPDPTCRTCALYAKAGSECMHYDTSVRPGNRACEHYQEDQWEVFRLAGKVPPETADQMRAMRREGKSLEEIAAELGVSHTCVRKYTSGEGIDRRKAVITTEMLQKARELRRQSVPWREVARQVGASVKGLRARIDEQPAAVPELRAEPAPTPLPAPAPAPAPAPQPSQEAECETCIHQAVCRYQEVYQQHKDWVLCRHYAREARAS